MNGEEKKLAVEMWELWVKNHDCNAEEHRRTIKELAKKLDDLINNIKCGEHQERMVWMQRWIALGFAYTTSLAVWFQWILTQLHGK